MALAAVAVLGGLVLAAGLSALRAADALEGARSGLARAQAGATTPEESLRALRAARADVDRADDALDGWHVGLVAAVPVLGRSWDVERAVTRTAQHAIAGAAVLAEQLPAVRAEAGGVDLQALGRVRQQLAGPVERSKRSLTGLRQTSAGLTPGRVADGRADALAALGPAVETLATAERALGLVSGLLGESGPRRLLVLLQNNAELRGAGGYAASFATGRLDEGRMSLDPLRDVISVADPPERARRVPAPAEYQQDFAALAGDTTIWRSWNMSPHVPDSAVVGARVAGALLGEEPDVVVLLDVPAMGTLAGLGDGGVALPDGSRVSADELTEALLVDSYAQAGADLDTQIRRRAELQAAATSAVTRLLAGDVPASEAARALARLVDERHLSVWSARPDEQNALVELGAAGAVVPPAGGDLSHVSVNNVGGNKLDVYVDRRVTVDVTVFADRAEVVQRARFTNRAPDGLVPYVAGPDRPGVVVSRVELSVPPRATGVRATLDGRAWPGTSYAGPERRRVATRLELPRGASSQVEVRYRLPIEDGSYRLRVVPQALAEDATLALTVRPAPGERLGEVAGAELSGPVVQETGPLVGHRDVQAVLHRERPSRWERFQQWWNSPVELG